MNNKILVVDDEAGIRRMLVKRLKQLSYEVVEAETGKQAVEMVKSKSIDLVLLDQLMPEMDGLETFENIKKVADPTLPVIMLTAVGSIKLVLAFQKAGGSDFEEKPVDFDVLHLKIERAIRAAEKIRREIEQRQEAEKSLQEANAKLDKRVRERTAELTKSNTDLKKQIAERKRIEQDLLESEKRYEIASKAGHVGIWDWNLITNEIYVDPNLKAILGYKDNEIKNHLDDWGKHVFEDDVPAVMEQAKAHINGLTPQYEVVHRMLHKDGSIRWMLARGTAHRDENGKAYRIVGTDTDITGRKEAEEALRVSEEKFSKAFRNSPDSIIFTSLKDGLVVDANKRTLDITGYSREELIGRRTIDMDIWVNSEDRNRYLEMLQKNKSVVDLQADFRMKSGEIRTGLLTGEIITLSDGDYILGTIRDITDRKQAEEALRASEEQLNSFFNNAPVGLAIWDREFRYVHINKILQEINGPSQDAHIGKTIHEVLPEAAPVITPLFEQVLSSGKPIQNMELSGEVPSRPGETTHYLISYFPLSIEDGVPSFIGGAIVDITESKRRDEALQESQRRLSTLMNNLPGMAYRCKNNSQWTMEFVSKGCKGLTGYKPEDLVGDAKLSYADLIHSDDRQMVWDLIQTSLRDEKSFQMIYRINSADGLEKWVWEQGQGIFDEQKNIIAIEGFITDITERKKVEEELSLSENRFRHLAMNANLIPWEADSDTLLFNYVGEQAAEILGFPAERWLEPGFWVNQIHPDDRDWTTRYCKDCSQKMENYDFEYRMLKQDGTVVWFHDIVNVVEGENGSRLLRGFMIDITERKQAEENLVLSRKRYKKLFVDSPVSLWEEDFQELYLFLEELRNKGIKDFQTYFDNNPAELQLCSQKVKIIDVNQATLRMHGAKSKDELLGNLHKIFTEASLEDFKGEVVAIASGRSEFRTEGEVRTLAGESRHVYLELKLDEDWPNTFKALLATVDITDRKRAEEELHKYQLHLEELVDARTSELMSANKELESFSYSVSHDLRAPLRHISGYADLLIRDFTESLPDKGEHYLKSIKDSVHHMGALIDGLLQFSRTGRQEMQKTTFEMSDLIKDAKAATDPDAKGRNIEWIISSLPRVYGDHLLLRLVWINLLNNAVKFTRKKKKARIEIGFRKEHREFVFFVRDNGAGFDERYAQKLFGVFQRLHTVDEFEGTGIGLANVRRIIARHDGRTWAEAEPEKGATFYFSLPINKD